MKEYTVWEIIICFLLGIMITVPICTTPQEERVETIAPIHKEIPVEIRAIELEPTEVEETPVKWIDGGYGDRVYMGDFKVTAYCSCEKCCNEWSDGYTYTGTIATEGRTIAVDPSVIPLGSIVEINGINYQAEDIGGAIKGNRVDIYFDSHKEALEWGVQYHGVYMVEECLGGF